MKCRPGKWSVRWIKNWLNPGVQKVVVSSPRSCWRLVPGSGGCWYRYWSPSVMTWMIGQSALSKPAGDTSQKVFDRLAVLPFRETPADWTKGPRGSFWTKGSVKSHAWEECPHEPVQVRKPGVLCLVLGSLVQGRRGHPEVSPVEGREDEWWTGVSGVGESEGDGTV